jgi:Tol biopolymer transport system component
MTRRFVGRVALIALLPILTSGCIWTVRASVDANGGQANGASSSSSAPSLSGDGRYVAFASDASNLVPGDTNGRTDIFVRDNRTGTVERVSVSSAGVQSSTGADTPAISEDGRYVAFLSFDPDLAPGDTNDQDVFVHDRVTDETDFLSFYSSARRDRAPVLSATGRFVMWWSDAFPGFTVFDRDTDIREDIAPGSFFVGRATISDDGRFVAFDRAGSDAARPFTPPIVPDSFVYDRDTGALQQVPFPEDFGSYGIDFPAISGDGRYVAFEYLTQGEVPPPFADRGFSPWVWDRQTGAMTSIGPFDSGQGYGHYVPQITDDGRFVMFGSGVVHVVDVATGRTTRVDTDALGRPLESGTTQTADISDDGRYVVLASTSDTVVGGDTNGVQDVFVRAFPEPKVDSIALSSVARGASATVMVNGQDFVATPSVRMGAGVTVDSVTWVSATQLTAQITVSPNAPSGKHDVIVENAGTGPGLQTGATGVCLRCLTIT